MHVNSWPGLHLSVVQHVIVPVCLDCVRQEVAPLNVSPAAMAAESVSLCSHVQMISWARHPLLIKTSAMGCQTLVWVAYRHHGTTLIVLTLTAREPVAPGCAVLPPHLVPLSVLAASSGAPSEAALLEGGAQASASGFSTPPPVSCSTLTLNPECNPDLASQHSSDPNALPIYLDPAWWFCTRVSGNAMR